MSHKIGAIPRLLGNWLKLSETIKEKNRLRELLVDEVTGLPTLPFFLEKIKEMLQERREVGLLCVNVVKHSQIKEIREWKILDDVMRAVAESLSELIGQSLRGEDVVAGLTINGNSFVILLSPPRRREVFRDDDLAEIKKRVDYYLQARLNGKLSPLHLREFACYVGGTTLRYIDEQVKMERLIYFGLERALRDSELEEVKDIQGRARELKKIIERKDIRVLFHPVVNFISKQILGYEALCRGPRDTEFEKPGELFKMAHEGDVVLELDRVCRERVLESVKNMKENQLLFINIEPDSIDDPQLREMATLDFLNAYHLNPDRIVLEITERSAISDFALFRGTLKYFRGLGFKISVDDAGAGYASLQCIAEVKPDFIKIDMSLIRDIDKDIVKQQLIKAFVMFTNSTGVRLIAEGIETPSEVETLVNLGVELGQGFLFGHPSESLIEAKSLKQL